MLFLCNQIFFIESKPFFMLAKLFLFMKISLLRVLLFVIAVAVMITVENHLSILEIKKQVRSGVAFPYSFRKVTLNEVINHI